MKINHIPLALIAITLLTNMLSASAAGLHKEYKLESLERLRSYDLKNSKRSAMSAGEIQDLETHCDETGRYSHDNRCLEQKFIREGYYVIELSFVNDGSIPKEPRPRYIQSGSEGVFDYTDRDFFLLEWSDAVFRKYLGNNFDTFKSVELKSINDGYIFIELMVSDPDQVAEIFNDPRVASIKHIGSPPELEEISES